MSQNIITDLVTALEEQLPNIHVTNRTLLEQVRDVLKKVETKLAETDGDKFLDLLAKGCYCQAEQLLDRSDNVVGWPMVPRTMKFNQSNETKQLFVKLCYRGLIDMDDNNPHIHYFFLRQVMTGFSNIRDWFMARITPSMASVLRFVKMSTVGTRRTLFDHSIIQFLCLEDCDLEGMKLSLNLRDTEGNLVFPRDQFWTVQVFSSGDINNPEYVNFWMQNIFATTSVVAPTPDWEKFDAAWRASKHDEARQILDQTVAVWPKIANDLNFESYVTVEIFFRLCLKGWVDLETHPQIGLFLTHHSILFKYDYLAWFESRISPKMADNLRAYRVQQSNDMTIVEYLCSPKCHVDYMTRAFALRDTMGNLVFPVSEFWTASVFRNGDCGSEKYTQWWLDHVFAPAMRQ